MIYRAKVILGIATFLPMAFLVIIFGIIIYCCIALPSVLLPGSWANDAPFSGPHLVADLGGLLIILTILTIAVLMIVYLILILRNHRLGSVAGAMWVVGVVFLSLIVMPIYWHDHVWCEPEGPAEPAGLNEN